MTNKWHENWAIWLKRGLTWSYGFLSRSWEQRSTHCSYLRLLKKLYARNSGSMTGLLPPLPSMLSPPEVQGWSCKAVEVDEYAMNHEYARCPRPGHTKGRGVGCLLIRVSYAFPFEIICELRIVIDFINIENPSLSKWFLKLSSFDTFFIPYKLLHPLTLTLQAMKSLQRVARHEIRGLLTRSKWVKSCSCLHGEPLGRGFWSGLHFRGITTRTKASMASNPEPAMNSKVILRSPLPCLHALALSWDIYMYIMLLQNQSMF